MVNSILEKHNFKEINNLNQRGGRMLSIIDLLKDGTLNSEIAGFLLYSMMENKSFLTAANPSGTGKTTLMGALLGLLKPGVRIKTINNHINPDNIQDHKNIRFLIHEIGDGPYYSYIWGKDVSNFFQLGGQNSLASCMHADTLKEMKNILFNPPLSVNEIDFYNLDLILFMKMSGNFTSRIRRISEIYGSCDNKFIKLYEWESKTDKFKRKEINKFLKFISNKKDNSLADIKAQLDKSEKVIKNIKKKDIIKLEQVRKEIRRNYF
ncbi:MAG: hypothetical protein ACOCQS_01270 [Bacillota bacterium]